MDTTEILLGARLTVEGLADRLAEILGNEADSAGSVSSEWTMRDARCTFDRHYRPQRRACLRWCVADT